MIGTRTPWVDLERLQRAGPEATLIVRLMMAANDIALANREFVRFREDQPGLRRHEQFGACQYFILLQCGHISEAMLLIKEIHQSGALSGLIEQCSSESKEAYRRLIDCLVGGKKRTEFNRYVRAMRDKIAFHYDPEMVSRALADRASQPDLKRSTVTEGTDITRWRFNLADDIRYSIVCRELWKIPRTANLRSEADRISDFGSGLCKDFIGFSGDLTLRYIRQHAAIS